MNKIEIYTTKLCPFCIKAKKLLSNLNLDYIEHDVEDSFDEMCSRLGKQFGKSISTVPQIIINEQYIGGYSDLEALYKSGDLKNYLNE